MLTDSCKVSHILKNDAKFYHKGKGNGVMYTKKRDELEGFMISEITQA